MRDVLAEREDAVVHVTRFVLDDVLEELLEERLARDLVERAERAERQTLHHDLHAEELHVPSGVAHERIDDHEEVVVDVVELLEFGVEVAMEDLHVPRLVHHLRRAVEFPVEELHGLRDLRGGEERTLLSVEELAELPRQDVRAELVALLLVELHPELLDSVHVEEVLGDHRHLGVQRIDVRRPIQTRLAVPLLLLGAPIERLHLGLIARVAPVEECVVARGNTRGYALLTPLQDQTPHR